MEGLDVLGAVPFEEYLVGAAIPNEKPTLRKISKSAQKANATAAKLAKLKSPKAQRAAQKLRAHASTATTKGQKLSAAINKARTKASATLTKPAVAAAKMATRPPAAAPMHVTAPVRAAASRAPARRGVSVLGAVPGASGLLASTAALTDWIRPMLDVYDAFSNAVDDATLAGDVISFVQPLIDQLTSIDANNPLIVSGNNLVAQAQALIDNVQAPPDPSSDGSNVGEGLAWLIGELIGDISDAGSALQQQATDWIKQARIATSSTAAAAATPSATAPAAAPVPPIAPGTPLMPGGGGGGDGGGGSDSGDQGADQGAPGDDQGQAPDQGYYAADGSAPDDGGDQGDQDQGDQSDDSGDDSGDSDDDQGMTALDAISQLGRGGHGGGGHGGGGHGGGHGGGFHGGGGGFRSGGFGGWWGPGYGGPWYDDSYEILDDSDNVVEDELADEIADKIAAEQSEVGGGGGHGGGGHGGHGGFHGGGHRGMRGGWGGWWGPWYDDYGYDVLLEDDEDLADKIAKKVAQKQWAAGRSHVGYVAPEKSWFVTPGAIKSEMDKVQREIDTLSADINAYRSADPSFVTFHAGWLGFVADYKKFYDDNAGGVGGWLSRLWGSIGDQVVNYVNQINDWRAKFKSFGGAIVTEPAVTSMIRREDPSATNWKPYVIGAGVLVGVGILGFGAVKIAGAVGMARRLAR